MDASTDNTCQVSSRGRVAGFHCSPNGGKVSSSRIEDIIRSRFKGV